VSLIAGYVARLPQRIEPIRERLRSFAIVPGESGDDYYHCVVATLFGHLLVKHKTTYPIRPQLASDAAGNVLVILGFVFSGAARTLLARAVATGGRSLEACEGEFVAVFVEAATGIAHVVNDRFSSRPFYTLRRVDGVFFSSNPSFLLTLAGAFYRPDVIGWLEVCTAGHTVGTRTTAEGVERLPPATHLTIGPGQVSERRYWHLEHRPDPGLDASIHSAEVFRAFRSGVERRVQLVGDGVLGVSGGLDSRMVAGALPRAPGYSAFTFIDIAGASATPETRAAAAVCSAMGLPHRIEALPARCEPAATVIGLTGGMRPFHHMAVVMAYIDEIRRCGTSFLMGGGPGDSLAGAFVPSADYLDPARTAECLEDACRRRLADSRGWPLMFRDEVIANSRRAVADAIAESFAGVKGPTAAHRVTAWAMTCRQPAFTFTSVMHTHPDVSEAFCHLDYRYADLMLQLPATWLFQRAFYAYMIHAELPQLRHIHYANTGRLLSGVPPSHDIPRQSRGSRSMAVAWSLGSRIAHRLVPARGAGASLVFRDVVLLDHVQELLHSLPLLREIVDVERCDRLLARSRAGACPSQEVLGTLTSLCFSAAALRCDAPVTVGKS
jgi:hypothetical protein